MGLSPQAWLDTLQQAEAAEETAFVAKIAAIVSFAAAKAARPALKIKRFRWLRRIAILDEFSGLSKADRAAAFELSEADMDGIRKRGDYSVVRMLVRDAAAALAPGAMMETAPRIEGALVEREAEVALTGKGRDARAARAEFLDRTSAKKGRDPKEQIPMRLPPNMEERLREMVDLYDRFQREKALRGEVVDVVPDYESTEVDAARVLPSKPPDA